MPEEKYTGSFGEPESPESKSPDRATVEFNPPWIENPVDLPSGVPTRKGRFRRWLLAHRQWLVGGIATLVLAGILVGAWAVDDYRRRVELAHEKFDAAVLVCEDEAEAAEESKSEGRDEAVEALTAVIADATQLHDEVVDSGEETELRPATAALLDALATEIEAAQEILETPVETIYRDCIVTPSWLLSDVEESVTPVAEGITPSVAELATATASLEAAIENMDTSELDAALDDLFEALAAAQAAYDGTQGRVLDETVRAALADAISAAHAIADDPAATPESVAEAEASLVAPVAAVIEAERLWLIESQRPTPPTAPTTPTSPIVPTTPDTAGGGGAGTGGSGGGAGTGGSGGGAGTGGSGGGAGTGGSGGGAGTGGSGGGAGTGVPGDGTETGDPGDGTETGDPGDGTGTGVPGDGTETGEPGGGTETDPEG